jgi:hypothetical protein
MNHALNCLFWGKMTTLRGKAMFCAHRHFLPVSVRIAVRLAALYNQSLLQLLVPEKESWPKEHLSEKHLAEKAKTLIAQKGFSQDEANDQVGWYLETFLLNPKEYVVENPIMFLKDLSLFLEVNWLCSIPNSVNS